MRDYDALRQEVKSSPYTTCELKGIIFKLLHENKSLCSQLDKNNRIMSQHRKLIYTLEDMLHSLMKSRPKNINNIYDCMKKVRICLRLASAFAKRSSIILHTYDLEGCSSSSDDDEMITLREMTRIHRIAESAQYSLQRTINSGANGAAEESTPKNLPNGDIGKTTRKRKLSASASNNSTHKPASKRSKKSTFEEQSKEDTRHLNLRNSFEKSKRKTVSKKGEKSSEEESSDSESSDSELSASESSAAESQIEEPMSIPTSVKSVRGQRKGYIEESTADESENEKYVRRKPPSVKRHKKGYLEESTADESENEKRVRRKPSSVKQQRKGYVDESTADESEIEKCVRRKPPSTKKQRKGYLDESTADESEIEKLVRRKPPSVKRQKRGYLEESTANESENVKSLLRKPPSVKRQKSLIQVESGSQGVIRNAVSSNRGASGRGRSSRQIALNVDNTSQDETFKPENGSPLNQLNVSEMKAQQIEGEPNDQNLRNSFEKSNREQTLLNKKVDIDSQDEFSAEESQNEEPMFTPNSGKYLRKQRWGSQEESTADESQNEELVSSKPTPVRRRKRQGQVESVSQDEIKNAGSRNSGTSIRGRRGRRTAVSIDDTSQDETFKPENETLLNQHNVPKMKAQQIEGESNYQNLRNSFEKSNRKQTLPNKRVDIDSQDEFSAEESQNEEPANSLNFVRQQRSFSQEESTADESQNELVNENPTSVRRRKRRGHVEPKAVVNRNTGTCRRGRSRLRAINAEDASQDGTLISSKNKTSLNELSVVCYDVLTDPAFESDPVVSKFKKDKLLNCDLPRDDEISAKGDTYEIRDEIDDEQVSLKNLESEGENLDNENINDSSKQGPSTPAESEYSGSQEPKTAVSRYGGTSRRGRRGRRGALSIDDASQDETSVNQPNVSGKEDVYYITGGHSKLDFEKNFDSADVGQEDKPEKMCNGDEVDLNKVGETDSNADEAKTIDAQSKNEEDCIDNESESSMVKENADEEADNPAGNHCTSSPDKDSLGRSILDSYVHPIYGRKGPATPPGIPPDSDGSDQGSNCGSNAGPYTGEDYW